MECCLVHTIYTAAAVLRKQLIIFYIVHFSLFCCISFFLLLDVQLKLKRQDSGLVPVLHGSAHPCGSAA